MPAVSLTTLANIPYVYSGTTPSTPNTCQLVSLPTTSGVTLIVHNRDKASRALRVSFDPTLTQGGASPAMFFSIGDPLIFPANHASASGFQPASTLALFSDSASVNYELLFVPG